MCLLLHPGFISTLHRHIGEMTGTYKKKKVFSFAFLLEQGSLVSAEFIFARVRGCIYYYPANREMQFYFNHVETQRLCFSLRILGITFPPHLARSCLLQGCKLAPVNERSPFELGSCRWRWHRFTVISLVSLSKSRMEIELQRL